MNAALHLAAAVLEGEDPKEFLKRMSAAASKPHLEPGEEVCHATGITRDLLRSCFEALKNLDPATYQEELNDEVQSYLGGNENLEDFDPEWYLFEHLYSVLQKYCPPFTYFGNLEADGTLGCWPIGSDGIEEAVDRGDLTFVNEGQEPERYAAILNGDFSTIQTPYVMVKSPGATYSIALFAKTGKKIWEW